MEKKISNVIAEADKTYTLLNNFISDNGDIELLDYLYPEHDGEYIAERCANLMMLRQSCYSLRKACDMAIDKLNRIIPENEQL